ncbi:MAG: hypothetical protein ACOC4M_16790 [Promethearchaeia archaeon]
MESIRRAKTDVIGLGEKFSHLSTSKIKIKSFSKEEVEGIVPNYPFQDQTIYRGNYTYKETTPLNEVRNIEGSFQIRKKSGLFILQTRTDRPTPEEIIEEINSKVDESFKIYKGIIPARDRMWEFINKADQIIDVRVVDEGEIKDINEIEKDNKELFGEYPIESAQACYSYKGEDIHIIYTGKGISIKTDNETHKEYIIQLFEKLVLRGE